MEVVIGLFAVSHGGQMRTLWTVWSHLQSWYCAFHLWPAKSASPCEAALCFSDSSCVCDLWYFEAWHRHQSTKSLGLRVWYVGRLSQIADFSKGRPEYWIASGLVSRRNTGHYWQTHLSEASLQSIRMAFLRTLLFMGNHKDYTEVLDEISISF